MKQNNVDVLQQCIDWINAGYSVDDCLRRHPEHAEELGELLKTTKELSALRVDAFPSEARERSKVRLLSQAKAIASSRRKYDQKSLRNVLTSKLRQTILSFTPAVGRVVVALGIAGIFLLLSGGLLITSAKSLPGDSLYPVKLAVEDLRYRLASNVDRRHEFENRYTKQRVEEVKSLLQMGRSHQVSFESVVISISDAMWNVGGIAVEVSADTITVGGIGGAKDIEPGMVIEIEGKTNPNGWVEADELHIREYQIIGSVDRISSSYWLISGIKVNIPGTVRIDTAIKTGDDVYVNVHSEDRGLYAISILRVNRATATPTLIISATNTSSEEDDNTIKNKEKYFTQGMVEDIKERYWVVNGEIYFVVSSTEYDKEIIIGDEVRVEYIFENNGSSTAIKIERNDSQGEFDGEEQETPQPTEIEDVQATSEVTETEEHKDGDHTPEPSETPHPSETPEHDD